MRFSAGIAALAFAIVLLAGCGGGGGGTPPPTYGKLQGYLYTETRADGKYLVASGAQRTDISALEGATVSINGVPALTTTTNNAGAFTMGKVPAGTRELVVSAPGVPIATFTVNIVANSVTPVNQAILLADAKWTVLVYMAADNDLESYAIDDIDEMERAVALNTAAGKAVNVIIQVDRSPYYDNTNGNWSGARRYEILPDAEADTHTINSRLLEILPLDAQNNFDMAKWENLRDFITWGQQMYPAEHYMVVLWNHGSGWNPYQDAPNSLPAGAIAQDGGSWNWLRDIDIPKALAVPERVEVVATDACLMAMLEVAYELRNSADYLVASTAAEPGEGYDYSTVLKKLMQTNGAMTARELAMEIPKEAIKTWAYDYRTTCSAIELAKVADVAAATDALANRLAVIGPSNATALTNAWSSVLYHDGSQYAKYKIADLGHYAALLASTINDDPLKSAVATLNTAMGQAVIANYYNTSVPSTGMSIYLPRKDGFGTTIQQSYRALAFSSYGWDEWLAAQPAY